MEEMMAEDGGITVDAITIDAYDNMVDSNNDDDLESEADGK